MSKKEENKCSTKYCRNRIKKSNARHKKCHKCRMRVWRANNPGKAAYHNKRSHATRKGLEFTLTLSEFFSVWVPGHVIDRIDATEGYHIWNVQPLTKFENDSKGATVDKENWKIKRNGYSTSSAAESRPSRIRPKAADEPF